MMESDSGEMPSVNDQARDWVMRLASDDVSQIEIDRCKAWLASDAEHRKAFEHCRRMWQGVADHPELFAANWPARSGRNAPARRWGRARHAGMAMGAIAASLFLALTAPAILLWAQADYATPQDKMQTIALPDGSTAVLDRASAIAVDFGQQERRITLLRGNAFFTVRHGDQRPFRVSSQGSVTEDIGTSFEVRQDNGGTQVAVSEGMVRFEAERDTAQARLTLQVGDTASLDRDGNIVRGRPANAKAVAAWRNGELLIDHATTQQAIAMIARYRKAPTWIWADLPNREPVSGLFRTDGADHALEALAQQAGLSVRILPGGIAIVTAQATY